MLDYLRCERYAPSPRKELQLDCTAELGLFKAWVSALFPPASCKTQENRPTGERGTFIVALANSSLACGFPEEMQTSQTTLGCRPKHLWTSSIKVLKTLVLTQIFCSSIKTTGPPVSLFRETVCLWHLNKGVYLRNGWVPGKSYNKSSLCLLTFNF